MKSRKHQTDTEHPQLIGQFILLEFVYFVKAQKEFSQVNILVYKRITFDDHKNCPSLIIVQFETHHIKIYLNYKIC